eukprot:comp11028_c0_seq1/m.5573 comp11028_c0_seq1/g.5573  ORF comp11028_c0_seq1/g.5573 comp11028_c0_seq1/m.5573 type:complete len:136 (-) comp11028_c0_seq1:537-944(-)
MSNSPYDDDRFSFKSGTDSLADLMQVPEKIVLSGKTDPESNVSPSLAAPPPRQTGRLQPSKQPRPAAASQQLEKLKAEIALLRDEVAVLRRRAEKRNWGLVFVQLLVGVYVARKVWKNFLQGRLDEFQFRLPISR